MAGDLDNPGKAVISPSKLAHVVLRTSNLAGMSSFYSTFLGAQSVFQNDFMTLLTYDSEHHRIGIIGIPPLAPKNTMTCGLEHIAFTFDTLNELALAYLQRKENGIRPFWTTNHGPTTSLYYKDPDGNILETQVDNFDTHEEVDAFMTGDAYRLNPIGVDFDADEWVKRLKNGEDHKSIKTRIENGPRGIDTVPV